MMMSCSNLRMPIARKLRLQYLSTTASHNNAFGNSVKDALKTGEKYGTLSLAILAILGAVAGVSTTLTANDEKLKANDEKIASLEKLMDEKINSSVQKSVHVALENFLKYSYSNEYKDMRENQIIVSKDNMSRIINDTKTKSDDTKNKTKE